MPGFLSNPTLSLQPLDQRGREKEAFRIAVAMRIASPSRSFLRRASPPLYGRLGLGVLHLFTLHGLDIVHRVGGIRSKEICGARRGHSAHVPLRLLD